MKYGFHDSYTYLYKIFIKHFRTKVDIGCDVRNNEIRTNWWFMCKPVQSKVMVLHGIYIILLFFFLKRATTHTEKNMPMDRYWYKKICPSNDPHQEKNMPKKRIPLQKRLSRNDPHAHQKLKIEST